MLKTDEVPYRPNQSQQHWVHYQKGEKKITFSQIIRNGFTFFMSIAVFKAITKAILKETANDPVYLISSGENREYTVTFLN